MPPKKGTAKTKTPAKPAATAEVPSTVTSSKGKVYETSAAAGRPRRASNPTVETPAPKKSATKPATAATKKATATTTGKKRGRPALSTEDAAEPPKKRGRPAAAAKKRGRPAKTEDAPAVPENENGPPKKRGRPPKGGETTKIAEDDPAAAEQLEEELVDAVVEEGAVEPSKRTSPMKKRGRPAKAKGKAAVSYDGVEKAEAEDVVAEASGPQFWLMKAEQEDREETLHDGSVFNAKFTIDDLREKGGPEPWDGVRNPAACKNTKDMKLGDLAFFYASGGKKGRVPGIVGIMEVVREAEPDLSAFDESSYGYVEKATTRGTQAKPRWFMVHVEFRKKLTKPVTLAELKKYTQEGGALVAMQEFTAARLSVSKVTPEEWDFITQKLIDGYEDEDEVEDAGAVKGFKATAAGSDLPNVSIATPPLLPNGTPETTAAWPTIESDLPTTDTLLAAETAATSSKPTSRAASKKPGSRSNSRPASRNGNLAVPRATSRGRSHTPRAGSAQPMTALPEELEDLME